MKCVLMLGVVVTSLMVVVVVESRIATQTWPQTEVGDGKSQLLKMFNFQQSFISMQNALLNLQEFIKSVDYNSLVEDVKLLQTELNSAKTKLDFTESKLDNTKMELDNTKMELDHTKAKLENTEEKLDNRTMELDNTETELWNMKANLENTKIELDNTKTKLDHTEVGLRETTSKLDSVDLELGETKKKLQSMGMDLKAQITAVSTGKANPQIGFHMRLSSDTHIESSSYIVTPWTSLSNYNNSFSPSTGKFTAPCNGLYFFLASSGSYQSDKYGNLRLEGSGLDRMSETWVRKYSTFWSMGSCHAVVRLVKSQTVWLACGKTGGCYFDEESTSFSGFLISADN